MSIAPFLYSSQAARVIFGPGTLAQLGDEIGHLGASRALILSTPAQRDQAERVAALLGARCAGIFDQAVMHIPMATVHAARAAAQALGADCAVAIGGGSTIGLGKAIALDSALPIIAVPTTYAGSEMTPIYGITLDGLKTTGRDMRVLPKTVIYDPELCASLPVELAVTSGINAIAHAAEGLYARDSNPVMGLIAQEAIRAIAAGLPRIVADPQDLAARADCLYGAWLSGMVLANVGMALHHKLCHTLGGSFNLPHAQTHTVVLAHAIAYNAEAAPLAAARISRALGREGVGAGAALYDLAQQLGAPLTLQKLGLQETDLDRAAQIAMGNPYWNPRPIDLASLRQLLQDAYDGRRPG